MGKKTDYQKLWRQEKIENIKLVNLLAQANGRIEAQAEVIRMIKDGKLKPEDILAKGEK